MLDWIKLEVLVQRHTYLKSRVKVLKLPSKYENAHEIITKALLCQTGLYRTGNSSSLLQKRKGCL